MKIANESEFPWLKSNISPRATTLKMVSMETTTIAGARVSRIGLGTWPMGGREWGAVPEDVAIATCLGAIERGINLIDTAPIYGHGRSEEIVGKAIRAHGRREDFFIATKAGLEWNERGVFANSTASRLRRELEDSLRRLGTDYIDLYQVHWPDPLRAHRRSCRPAGRVPARGQGARAGREQLQRRADGGVSRSCPAGFESAALQPLRAPDRVLRARRKYFAVVRRRTSVAVLTWSSLCRSLLAGRAHRGMKFDAKDIRNYDPKFQEPRFSQYMTAVERLTAFAHEHYGKSLPELAVRWVLDRPGVSVALWGAKSPEQLDAVAGVMGWKLDASAMAEIDRIVEESVTDPVGPEYLNPKVRAN